MGRGARRRVPARASALASSLVIGVSGCWVTLDPILEGAPSEVGGGGGAGESAIGGSAGNGGASGGSGVLPTETCTVIESDSSEYALCPEPLPFAAAAAACRAWSAELAAIGAEAENETVAVEAYGPIGTNLWLGGQRDDALVWSWPDGSVFWRGARDGTLEPDAYAKWATGEPNDTSTVVDEPERCLALTLGGNDWNDRACSLTLPYACERPLVAAP